MRITLIIFGLLIAITSFAQTKDSTLVNTEELRNSLISLADTLKPLSVYVDSVKLSRADSLKKVGVQKADSIITIPKQVVEGVNQKLLGINKVITGANDSIGHDGQRDGMRGIDSLNNSTNAIINLQDRVVQKSDSLQEGVEKRIDNLQDKLEQKIKNKTGEEVNIAGFDKNSTDIPDLIEVVIPPIETHSKEGDIPAVDIPTIKSTIKDINVEGVDIDKVSEITQEVKVLKDSGQFNADVIQKISGSEKVGEVTDQIDDFKEVKSEVDKIKESNLRDVDTEVLEDRAIEFTGAEAIDTETQKLKALHAQQEAMLQRYKDTKLLKEEILRKSGSVKNDLIDKNSEAFKNAQKQIAKKKKLNSSVQSAKDMVKKRTNEMKGKPFIERLQPGITLQSFKGESFELETAIQLGYRLTGRWMIGAAGVHRFNFSEENKNFIASSHTYGYRGLVNFKVIKSFYVQTEYEHLKHPVITVLTKEKEMDHSSTVAVGLGKQFMISKRWGGSMMGLYRIKTQQDIPGVSKFGIRIGFDFKAKSKKNN